MDDKKQVTLSETEYTIYAGSKAVKITQKNDSYKNDKGEILTQEILLTFNMVIDLFNEIVKSSMGGEETKH